MLIFRKYEVPKPNLYKHDENYEIELEWDSAQTKDFDNYENWTFIGKKASFLE